jgi:hypothetical protein
MKYSSTVRPKVSNYFSGPITACLFRDNVQKETWCMKSYDGVDYKLTLCRLQSRLQNIYHGQPYARVDLDPIPESTFSPTHVQRI